MLRPFKLKGPIGLEYNMDLDDAFNTKKALRDRGHFRVPKYGLTAYPDQPMIDGIKSFQRKNRLREDGIMKPDGPTIKRLNETFVLAGGPGGLVQVDAYNQNRDGSSVHVSSHTRAAPGGGGDIATGNGGGPKVSGMKPSVPNARVRGKDDWGKGHFGADRKDKNNKKYKHKGVDIVTTPGETVSSPVNGTYVRSATPYTDDPRYSGAVIKADDGSEVKVLYISPVPGLKPGDKVEAGKTPLGTSQDIVKKYPGSAKRGPITNHVHIQVKKDGQFIDPTEAITGHK